MTRTDKQRIQGAVLALGLLLGAGPAHSFSSVIVFGDSGVDAGRRLELQGVPMAPYFQGRHSNGPTPMSVTGTNPFDSGRPCLITTGSA